MFTEPLLEAHRPRQRSATAPANTDARLRPTRANSKAPCDEPWVGAADSDDEEREGLRALASAAGARSERVLVVEDDYGVRLLIRQILEAHGFTVLESDSVRKAVEVFVRENPDLVVLDYVLGDGHALDLLPRLQDIDPDVPTIVLTGYGSIELAVRATKAGAANFLTKPVDRETLIMVVDRQLEQSRNRRRRLALQCGASRRQARPFLGGSPLIRRLEEETRRYLQTPSPILIEGETGVGKGVLARWIHENGPRARETFVDINCAGLTTAFLEAELFGHSKGAFTGATSAKPGLLEVANHGTVFLDEIADVDAQIQPKLLKVLEEKKFRRIGEVADRTTDVRLIAATNRDLKGLVEAGTFREDLFFRISVLPLQIPPLRARSEDILFVAHVILRRVAADLGRPEVYLSQEALEVLQAYPWPGNLRELRNTLERAVLLSDADALGPELLRLDAGPRQADIAPDTCLPLLEVERRHIAAVLAAVDGSVNLAARRLGVPRSTLYKKLQRFDRPPA